MQKITVFRSAAKMSSDFVRMFAKFAVRGLIIAMSTCVLKLKACLHVGEGGGEGKDHSGGKKNPETDKNVHIEKSKRHLCPCS